MSNIDKSTQSEEDIDTLFDLLHKNIQDQQEFIQQLKGTIEKKQDGKA